MGRKLRTALTAVAIVLGVAMVSGTYVLTDSIDDAFDRSSRTSAGTDVVSPRSPHSTSRTVPASTEAPFDESLLAEVRALPEVADAKGGVESERTQLVTDGNAIVFGGAPNLGFSIPTPTRSTR